MLHKRIGTKFDVLYNNVMRNQYISSLLRFKLYTLN